MTNPIRKVKYRFCSWVRPIWWRKQSKTYSGFRALGIHVYEDHEIEYLSLISGIEDEELGDVGLWSRENKRENEAIEQEKRTVEYKARQANCLRIDVKRRKHITK